MPWKNNKWVDDDGSLTVGTPFDAEHMNNVEIGIAENHDGVAAAAGVAGSALTNAASGVTAAGSALVSAQQANARAASGVTAAGSALVTGQFAGALAGSALFTGQQANVSAGSALFTGQKANTLAASGVAAAGSGVTGVTNLFNKLATAGEGVVLHGSNANLQRPFGFDSVIWVGTVEPVNAAELDPWINPEDFGINSTTFVPTCRVYKSGVQEILTGTVTAVTFDSERWDIGGIHSTVTNTTRLTAPKSGIYNVNGYAAWPAEITSPWFLAIKQNGTTIFGAQWQAASFQSEGHVSTEVFLNAGEYVELCVYQGQGKTIKTAAAGTSNYPNGVEMSMTWLGSGTPSLTPIDWGIVTELPSAAGVGDVCSLKVREELAGVSKGEWKLWRFRKIEASGSYPWAFEGGPPLLVEDEGSYTTSSTAFVALGTVLGVEPPVKGFFDMEWGVRAYGPAGTNLLTGLQYNGVADEGSLIDTWNGGESAGAGGDSRHHRKELTQKFVVIKEAHKKGAVAGTMTAERRWIAVTPERVG